MCSFLKKILSVAELYHLPFPSFKVKDLTLETAISQDAIPGLVTVLENSPQLKKLTVQPKLVNGTLLVYFPIISISYYSSISTGELEESDILGIFLHN